MRVIASRTKCSSPHKIFQIEDVVFGKPHGLQTPCKQPPLSV